MDNSLSHIHIFFVDRVHMVLQTYHHKFFSPVPEEDHKDSDHCKQDNSEEAGGKTDIALADNALHTQAGLNDS